MKILKHSILYAAMLIFSISITSCKETDKDTHDDMNETRLDSVSDVGSDGLGREVDTVSEIERDIHDPIDEDNVEP